jgi:predicted permease
MPCVRHVAKALIRRPWYAASIVTTLAVGCALLMSVLAIVDGVLFKPLGYPGDRQIMAVQLSSNANNFSQSVAPDDLDAWSRSAPGVAFTGFRQHSTNIANVQPSFFDVIGVHPALGGFTPADFVTATSLIEPRIVTDQVFRSEFGADPAAIGRVVMVDPSTGSGYRLVGVMPPGFVFPARRYTVGYLAPYIEERLPRFMLSFVIARMPPEASPHETAARILAAITPRNADRPGTNTGNHPIDRVHLEPLGRALGAASRPFFTALLVAAGLLVAIAGVNASSLMAARSVDRRRELAVRRALGATSFDITRLLLVESAMLVGAATAIGLAIAAPLLRVVGQLLPDDVALFREAVVDWRVAAFGAATFVVVAGVVAVWPLRLASRDDGMPGGGRSVTGEARSRSWRILVTAQVALALVLTLGGSLLVGSLLSVYAQTPSISTSNVLTIGVRFLGMTGQVGRMAPERAARANVLIERLKAVPGVETAALTAYNVLEHAYEPSRFRAPDSAVARPRATVTHAVTGEFYRVLEPQLVAGRLPIDAELATNAPVLVVSESLARQFWPDSTAIGRTLTDAGRNATNETALAFTVVGVVRDVRWAAWDEGELPTIYGPYALLTRPTVATVLIRSSGGISHLAGDALRVIEESDPLVRVDRVATLDELFVDSVRPRRFRAWLFGSFAVASLCVAGLGIFGQLAMSTARRTREVGIRMSCGATPASVARLILQEQLVPVVVGVVAGGIGAAWAVRFVASYLYQVTAFDARVWTAAIGLILLTSAAGTLVTAVRASRIDPTETLRAE